MVGGRKKCNLRRAVIPLPVCQRTQIRPDLQSARTIFSVFCTQGANAEIRNEAGETENMTSSAIPGEIRLIQRLQM
jgi:hypothetical protein